MKFFWLFAICSWLISLASFAKDCSTVKPFTPIGTQSASVLASRFYWKLQDGQYVQQEEVICETKVDVPVYDIRGREDDAYWCLQPVATQVVTCPLNYDNQALQLLAIPTIWIRGAGNGSIRDYHFHAFLVNPVDQSQFTHDIFARTLLTDLNSQQVILEGAYRDGLPSYRDGYFVRSTFSK